MAASSIDVAVWIAIPLSFNSLLAISAFVPAERKKGWKKANKHVFVKQERRDEVIGNRGRF